MVDNGASNDYISLLLNGIVRHPSENANSTLPNAQSSLHGIAKQCMAEVEHLFLAITAKLPPIKKMIVCVAVRGQISNAICIPRVHQIIFTWNGKIYIYLLTRIVKNKKNTFSTSYSRDRNNTYPVVVSEMKKQGPFVQILKLERHKLSPPIQQPYK